MSAVPPLGALAAFSGFTGPTPWGPDQAWRATFGSGQLVVDDLVAGLKAHPQTVDRRWSPRYEAYPVVLGCTPWLSSAAVVKALAAMPGCVVVGKRDAAHYAAVRALAADGQGVWQGLLGLEEWGPRDTQGNPPLIGPGRMPGDRGLEPLRVLGYAADGQPLMHAKLAVCCGAWRSEGDFGEILDVLTPLSVWVGSANWTQRSSQHIEFGAWTTDELFCQAALEFMIAVIKASEPLSSAAPGPLPELAESEWDDAAFAEYMQEE